jgi:hypothetical protein
VVESIEERAEERGVNEEKLLAGAEQEGFRQLKGYRSVGGQSYEVSS